jgi:hypothetical protein
MASGKPQNTNAKPTGPSASRLSPLVKKQGKIGKDGSSKKINQKEQSERFIETARKLEADECGKDFELAVGVILR